jgi:putative ABC transport system permease protein
MKMLKNYFITAIRILKRQKVFSCINIIGLSVSMACSFLILTFILFENSYDKYHEKRDRIFRMISTEDAASHGNSSLPRVPAELGPRLVREYPEVENSARILFDFDEYFFIKKNDEFILENSICAADNEIFDIFTIPVVRGDSAALLVKPSSLVITERIAEKYFETRNSVGKTLTIRKENQEFDLTVTGVIANFPPNSTFRADLIGSFRNHNIAGEVTDSRDTLTYILLSKGSKEAEIGAKVKAIQATRRGDPVTYSIQPLSDIYLDASFHPVFGITGSRMNIYIFSAIALLILLIAGINYVLLSTANSIKRLKEMGVRKVLGAKPHHLIGQFLGESTFLSFLALPIAVVLTDLALPLSRILFGKELAFAFSKNWILFLGFVLITLLLGVLSGAYISFYLSRFQAYDIFRGRIRGKSKKSYLWKPLIIFQLMVFTILIVCTNTIYQQMRFIQNRNLGFQKENLVMVGSLSGHRAMKHYDVYQNEIRKHPNILSVSGAFRSPSTDKSSFGLLSRIDDPNEKIRMECLFIDYDYVETFGMDMAAGRSFSREYSLDDQALILNESAVRMLDLKYPVGQSILDNSQEKKIIGVVKDFNVHSFHSRIQPLYLCLASRDWMKSQVACRISPENVAETLSFLEAKWKEISPLEPFELHFVDEEFDKLYLSEIRFRKTINVFTALAVFIACLGLFGLSLFNSRQRAKEICIRKILGAGMTDIIRMITGDFLILAFVANIVAFPFAYLTVNWWLRGFAYRVGISPFVFFEAAVLSIMITMLTISSNVVKASHTNPADSLRYE